MRLADEIRKMYAKPPYTFEDVTSAIRKHVFETYEEAAKYNFPSWPGFNVVVTNRIPEMKWTYGNEVSCVHDLLIPEDSIDFDWKKIGVWFSEQGFVYTSNENCRCEGWRIKF